MRTPLLALLFALLLEACAIPRNPFARPVVPAPEGSMMINAGGTIPFFGAAGTSIGDGAIGAGTAERLFIIPSAGVTYAWDKGYYFSLDAAVWSNKLILGTEGDDSFFIFVDPNFEIPMNDDDPNEPRTLSFTINGNLGYLRTDEGGVPFIAPTVGIRWYVPTNFGGLVVSQQVGTGIITLTTPGSVAYDIPIPLGDSTLHIFPEVRWDPTFFFLSFGNDGGGGAGAVVLVSGGISAMLQI